MNKETPEGDGNTDFITIKRIIVKLKKRIPGRGTETGELLAVKLFLLQIVKTELSGKRRDTNAGNKEKINKKLPENRTDDAIPLYTWKFI